jgi:hypothetical protein
MKKLSHSVNSRAICHRPRFFTRLAVMAHHQRAVVAPGDEAVVLAAVDLHLVVIEVVHQVARDERFRQRLAGGIRQLERRVRQVLDVVFPIR